MTSKQFEEIFQAEGYQFFIRLKNDTLSLRAVPLISTSKNNYFYCDIPKSEMNEKEEWDLKALRDHIMDQKNVKINLQEMSLSIGIKSKLFGRVLRFQILKVKLESNASQELEIAPLKQKEQKSKIQEDMDFTKSRKTIIVVGRMGHGKSSFVNSLIAPRGNDIPKKIKQKLLVTGADTQSITTQCQFVESNDSHQFFYQEPLYVIDTPGLNSEDAICLVSEQIDNIIIEKKCEIVGIAYVINLGADREIAGNDKCTIKEFMKLLKIKKEIKNNLLFFILTNWDNLTFKWKVPQMQKCLSGFSNLVKEVGVEAHESRIIKWANPFCSDEESYEFFLQRKNGKQIVKQQWEKLKYMIRKCQKKSLKLLKHIENVNLFWQKLMQKIFQEIENNNVSYKKELQVISASVQLQFQQGSNSTSRRLKNALNMGMTGVVSFSLGVLTIETGIGIVPLLAGGMQMASSILSLPIIGIMHLFSKKQKLQQKFSKDQNPQQRFNTIMRQKLIEQITLKIKSFMIQMIKKSIIISNDKITVNSIKGLNKTNKLELFYKYESQKIRLAKIMSGEFNEKHQISIKLTSEAPSQSYYDNMISENFRTDTKNERIPSQSLIYIPKNKNKLIISFELTCKLPKQENYYQLIEQQSEEMFGKYK